jgi:hypothetical protein
LEQAGKRINQQGYGQEKLIEIEVKRRIDVAVQDKINSMRSKTSVDEDEKALKAFI